MNKTIILLFISFINLNIYSQTCEELIESIELNNYGTTYNSYNSDAISKVTFYDVFFDYTTHYFAIVCFKKNYGYGCNEYIYEVGRNTKLNYSLNYRESAGKAFWKYIEPYNENLDCAPDFN